MSGAWGCPHEIKGQGIYAYVILAAGQTASDDLKKELVKHVRAEIGPIATGLASSVDAAQPLDTQTGLKQPSNESHYRTEYSIGDILAAVSEDMTIELEALIARQLHTPGPREEQPETQLVNAY